MYVDPNAGLSVFADISSVENLRAQGGISKVLRARRVIFALRYIRDVPRHGLGGPQGRTGIFD
ncbi:hypothetical protein F6X37_27500 [Paraburkholderia sp. 31.1]|uniref:hypothetical protein n=1 Tax=Paraburkholderia sp. 31.1 TaxID=2615205 RepID=UPI0016553B89|nr:hypothetical protein [Paraburkholderia sp. 31.1]MBC8725187.1 hypothetical protein [Paraburkholderia sp. 31.1]